MATSIASSFTRCQYVAQEYEEECQEEQYTLCPHCNLWLCLPHNLDHQQITQTRAHALNDQVNQVRQQLTEVSIDYLYDDSKKKIDEWREQLHAEIDTRHAEMLLQLATLHNELVQEVKEFKITKLESFTHEIVEPLTHMLTKQKQVHPERLKAIERQLQSLEQRINDIKDPDVICMNYDEVQLAGDVNFIRKHPCDEIQAPMKNQSLELEVVKQKEKRHFPLRPAPVALAASAHFILAFEKNSSKLLLFDTNIQLRSIDTTDKNIIDICWSDTMNLFFIAGKKLQTYDIISNNLINISVHIPQKNSDIWSVTCYFRDILLLHEKGVIQCYSYPSFTRKKIWLCNEYLQEDSDLAPSCIRFNSNGVLAMSIKQKDFHWRIDLFDIQLQRIHRGTPLINEAPTNSNEFEFISLINYDWLALNATSEPQMLLLFDGNGTLKQEIKKEASALAVMGEKFLVLSDKTGLRLYEFPEKV